MFTNAIDLLLAPLTAIPPFAGLLLLSLVVTLSMLLVVKVFSNATRLDRAKRQMYAALLEMRLFDDDLGAVLRAALDVFRQNLSYLWALAPSLIVATIPLVVLLAHLDGFYRTRGLAVGDVALLTVRLRDNIQPPLPTSAQLDVPAGVRIDTPPLWFQATNEVIWRVVPTAPGRFPLRLHVNGETISHPLDVSNDVVRRAPSRTRGTWLDDLLDPAASTLPESGTIREVRVTYPPRELRLFGWGVNWLVLLALSSVVFAFALRGPLGVSI